MIRAYNNRHLTLSSHARLPFAEIKKGNSAWHFYEPAANSNYQSLKDKLDAQLPGTQTAAFVVIRNDSIVYENYFNGYDKRSLLPSFSVVKSVVGTLTGICYEEGKIKSLQEPITNYLPKLLHNDERFKQITIQHLLDMRSGLQWNEGSYGLKDDAIKMAFRPNITPYIYKIKIKEPPGKQEYQSINTLLLALIIEKATGVSISNYLAQKIWQPTGMESNATWTTDKHTREIAYAGLNATARDFAKFGNLFLHHGQLNGQQIISKEWIKNTVCIDSMIKYEGYRNQFWSSETHDRFIDSLPEIAGDALIKGNDKPGQSTSGDGVSMNYRTYTVCPFYALGILGQYIYINPANNSVIVRLGYNWHHPHMSLHDFISSVSSGL